MKTVLRKKQQGMSTLVVSIALLLMTTMAVIFSANVSVMERKIAANDFRASQALLSAQAGIDIVLANISKFGLNNSATPPTYLNGEKTVNYNDGTSSKTSGYYAISIDKTLPDYPDIITVVSTGYSNDKAAKASVKQKLTFAPVMRTDSFNYIDVAPIIVDGVVSGSIDSNTVEINTDNIFRSDASGGAMLQAWSNRGITNSGTTTPGTTAPSVIDNSTAVNYNNSTPPLNRFFLQSVRDPNNTGTNTDLGVKQISTRSKCTSCTNPAAFLAANQPESKLHYLEGNITLNGLTIGSATYPVILVVDLTNNENFTLTNTTINGLLLVKGTWDNNNQSATINGAIVVEGGNMLQGNNLTVNYSSDVYNNLSQVGLYTRTPGSWNDVN